MQKQHYKKNLDTKKESWHS